MGTGCARDHEIRTDSSLYGDNYRQTGGLLPKTPASRAGTRNSGQTSPGQVQ